MSLGRALHGRAVPPAMIAIAAVIVAVGLAGCDRGGLTSDTATASVTPVPVTAPPTAAGTLSISGFAFGPPLTVAPGQVVSIVNADPVPHTVVADDKQSFDVQVGPNGRAFLTAPTAPGSYPFTCTIHPMMHGTLIVR